MNQKLKVTMIAAAVLALALAIGCGVYVSDYYHADETAVAAMVDSELAAVQQMDDLVVFSPEPPTAGFIFYPGGKVEHTAYAP